MKVCLELFFICKNNSGLIISFGVGLSTELFFRSSKIKLASRLEKFYVLYDNGVSLQTIVVSMKFPKEVHHHHEQFCMHAFFVCKILHVGYI